MKEWTNKWKNKWKNETMDRLNKQTNRKSYEKNTMKQMNGLKIKQIKNELMDNLHYIFIYATGRNFFSKVTLLLFDYRKAN